MSNRDISSWYVPEDKTVTSDEISGELNFQMPNEIIARKAAALESQQLMNKQGDAATDVPELPDGSVPSLGGEGVTMGEEIAQAVSPIVNPVMEVIDAINNTSYGFAYDALRGATFAGTLLTRNAQELIKSAVTGDEFEGRTGVVLDTPDILKNKSFVSDPETEAFLDKGGYYASLGMNLTAFARSQVNMLGRGVVNYGKNGARLNPRTGLPMTGVEGTRRGIARSVSQSSMPTEAKVGLGMAAGGKIAEELTESNSPLVSLAGELVGGLFSAASPARYIDKATGLVKHADTGLTVQGKNFIDLYDQKYGEDAVNIARRRLSGASVSPYEAMQALKNPDTLFTSATQTGDSGILTLERSLALADPLFKQNVDEAIDQAQFSLAKELESVLDPQTGAYNWEALEKLILSKKDDLLLQVDDRVAQSKQQLAGLLKVYEGDTTKMSKEFARVYKELTDDIYQQENNLWEPVVNSGYRMDTVPFKESIEAIVLSSNSQVKLPVKEFAEYLGMGIMRTGKGYKVVPMNLRGDKSMKGKEVYFPSVSVQRQESPDVIKRIRTNLNEMVRDPNKDLSKDALIKAQDAAVEAMEGSVESAPTALRDYYRTATEFSRKVNDTLKGEGVFPEVTKAPDPKKLETLMKGESQTDMAVVSDELSKLFGLSKEAGTSEVVRSEALKQAETLLMTKFETQVDPSDLGSFDVFIRSHKDWFDKFPEAAQLIKAARSQAQQQGRIVKDKELAAESVRQDFFVKIVGMKPNQVMDEILSSSNPMATAARFRKLLSGKENKEAMEVFRDGIARRFVNASMKNIQASISGKGSMQVVDPQSFRTVLKDLDPLLKMFKVKELGGLELLRRDLVKLEKALTAKGDSGDVGTLSVGQTLAAKVAAVKAVNLLFGSSSIMIAGSASNFATKSLQNMGHSVSNKILQDAMRNPELMKILLTKNPTRLQIESLNSSKFKTGRLLYKALIEKLPESE